MPKIIPRPDKDRKKPRIAHEDERGSVEYAKYNQEATREQYKMERAEKYLLDKYDIRNNTIKFEIELCDKNTNTWSPVNESDVIRDMKRNRILCNKEMVIDILKSNFVPKYNPIQDYFNALPKWDKKTDHIEKLASCIYYKGDQSFFNNHFKKHLIRTAKCAMDESYFNKHAFILVSNQQNTGKTTFIRNLCPPELQNYYTEHFSVDKDGLIAMCENFIINLDELAMLSRSDINQLKSALSKANIKVRAPYERKAAVSSRVSSFFGSTNDTEFLLDSTGSVRWLCFELESIDWKYKTEIDIKQVWAQALHLLNEKHEYNLSAEEISKNEENNDKYRIVPIEEELIAEYYEPGTEKDKHNFWTATDFLLNLQGETENRVKLAKVMIGKALKKLGFVQTQYFNGRYSVKGYFMKNRKRNSL